MTPLQRWFIIGLVFHIGCVALDNSISELEYEEDELHFIVGNTYSTDPISTDSSSGDESGAGAIVFHPKLYDFKECPVGIPRLGAVRIHNRLKEENIKLISISGNTVDFHSSFFADKVIGPGNLTSFDVVFLSREAGQFDAVLFIHTSQGLFKYPVRGVGLPNPYRLRPLMGATIPVNATYEPVITLHNPHDTRIVVVEMLSSGADFSLRLPEGVDEQNVSDAWTLEPFQTKAVMQGNFIGREEGNHTGFIRIRVNESEETGEYLMVPVEIQVTSAPGIYSAQASLDFGFMVRNDKPKTLSLGLINSEPSSVSIESVSVNGEENPAISIEFRPVILESDFSTSVIIALITFDPTLVTSGSQTSGFIEVRSDCGKTLMIPFTVHMVEGEFVYNASSLAFYFNGEKDQPRNFSLRSNFASPVAVYEVSVSRPDVVKVDILNQSHVILPGQTKTVCTLWIQKPKELCDSKSGIELTLRSNITHLKLPITCYDGKLEMFTVEGGQIDFGTVELHATHTEHVAFENNNPIEVRLKSWGSNSSVGLVELVGMQKGRKEDLTKIHEFDGLKKSLFLQPGHFAVFSIQIRRPVTEGLFYGEAFVITDQNQTLRVPYRFVVSRGSVTSETIVFDKAFPGKLSAEKLYLTSSFNHTVNLINLRSFPSGVVSFAASSLQEHPEIYPHRRNCVGKVFFDPGYFCAHDCYTGFSLESPYGKQWALGAMISRETAKIDTHIWNTLQNRFNKLKGETVSNISVWVDTSVRPGFRLKAETRFTWPRLSALSCLVFPLTSLENHTTLDLLLHNPSTLPVVLQCVLAQQYGKLWSNYIRGGSIEGNSTEGHIVFSWNNHPLSSHYSSSKEARRKLRKYFSDNSELLPGVLVIIPPLGKIAVSLNFSPISKDLAATLLILRNNLTGVETVWLSGKAGTGKLTVGSGSPGSSLMFQLTESLLQSCEKEAELSAKVSSPQVTVRRSFIARNVGEIPLEITSLSIHPRQNSFSAWMFGYADGESEACEGYGFRILNCHPFVLHPNQTHSIDIAFTPDFTLSKARSVLLLTDSTGGQFNYTLVALIPSNMLSKCSLSIPRPWWEWHFKMGGIMTVALIFVVTCSIVYFDASDVLSKTVFASVKIMPSGEMQPELERTQRLDLREVREKVENRFRKNHVESKSQSVSVIQRGQKAPSNSPVHIEHQSQSSNVRNRKGKRSMSDFISPVALATSKATAQFKPASSIDDAPIGFTATEAKRDKRDKERENALTPVQPATNANKKKKRSNAHGNSLSNQTTGKVRQNSSKGDLCGVAQKRTEEETSSTTTESSNPDDVASFPEAYETKTSRPKNAIFNTGKGSKSSKQEIKVGSDSQETVGPLLDRPTEKKHPEQPKKVFSKKEPIEFQPTSILRSQNDRFHRELSSKPDSAIWDPPLPPCGDGLCELAAQTEAFVSNWPTNRTSFHSQGIPYGDTAVTWNQSGNYHGNTALPKAPGVIGERPPSQGSAGCLNYHYNTPPTHYPQDSPIGNWIAPTTSGCNTWEHPAGGYHGHVGNVYTSSAPVGSGMMRCGGFSNVNVPCSTSGAFSYASACQSHYSCMTNAATRTDVYTTAGGMTLNGEAQYTTCHTDLPANSAFRNGGYNEDLKNPWDFSPTPAAQSAQSFSAPHHQNPLTRPISTVDSAASQQHLQRLGSDPAIRQGYPSSVASGFAPRHSWLDELINETERTKREIEERSRASWPRRPSPVSSLNITDDSGVDVMDEEWMRNIIRASKVWDSTEPTWPSNSDAVGTKQTTSQVDSKAVGSGVRTSNGSLVRSTPSPPGTATLQAKAEDTPMFNLFGVNIWSQNPTSTSDSSPTPTWGSFSQKK